MDQTAAAPKGRGPVSDGHINALDDARPVHIAASHSRVGVVLGWLQELLLLASLAVVCSTSFDIASGRTSHQLDDAVDMLRTSALLICAAIAIGLYLSISLPSSRSSPRHVQLSSTLASSSPQLPPHVSPLDVGPTSETPMHRRVVAAAAAACAQSALSDGPADLSSPRDAPSSYSPTFVSQLRGQLVHAQHQLYAPCQLPHFLLVTLFACPSKRRPMSTTFLSCGSSCSPCKRASAPCKAGA